MPRAARCRTVNWDWLAFLYDERVAEMDATCLGVWVRVLGGLALAEDPGRLRGTEAVLQRLAGATDAEWAASRGLVLAGLVRTEGGWEHARTVADHREQTDRIRAKSDAGRENAHRRWVGHGRPNGSPNGSPNATAMPPSFLHSVLPEETLSAEPDGPASPSRNGKDLPEGFKAFWEGYRCQRRVGKAACLTHWRKAKLEAIAPTVSSALEAFRLSPKWRDGFMPEPIRWLRAQPWLDDPADTPQEDGW